MTTSANAPCSYWARFVDCISSVYEYCGLQRKSQCSAISCYLGVLKVLTRVKSLPLVSLSVKFFGKFFTERLKVWQFVIQIDSVHDILYPNLLKETPVCLFLPNYISCHKRTFPVSKVPYWRYVHWFWIIPEPSPANQLGFVPISHGPEKN